MGKGHLRRKNALKKQYLHSCVHELERLEKENEALKSDPQSVVGQFIGQFRELHSQNSRLSVLAACLIKKLGDKVELTKEEMEAFKENRINISWELPEGVTEPAEAASFVFTYTLLPIQDQPQTSMPIPTEIPTVSVAPVAVDGELVDTLEEIASTESVDPELGNLDEEAAATETA